MRTDELIQQLTKDALPVKRLWSPDVRTLVWVAISLPWVAAVVYVMGLRPDLSERLSDTRWMVEQSAAFLVGIMAAIAAFCAGIPGRPKWEHFLPFPPLAVWLGTLVEGSVQDWLAHGDAGLLLRPDWQCLPGIIMVGFGPAIAMVVMLSRASPIAPMMTTALGALAAGGLAAVGLRLFHPVDASIMVLVWQVGSVFALTLLAGLSGPRLLRWRLSPVR